MLLVDITIVNVALPSIQRRLGASLSGLEWVVDAYAITLAALILTAGALADRFGRRLVFCLGVVVFSSASFLCGVAWNIAVLDVARGLQAVGGAALFATALALIGTEYQGAERGPAIAAWGATIGLAVASGPLLGGLITSSLGWRWIFFVNIPIAVFALGVAVRKVHESRDPAATHTDLPGLVCFSASLFLIIYALLRGNTVGWASPQILGTFAAGVVLLVVFVVVETRQARPMLDVALFKQPAFLGIQLATFCLGAGMFAFLPFLSIYLQNIDGYSPLSTGLRFLPLTAFVFIVPLVTRKLAARAPTWLLLASSLTLVGIGLLLLETVHVGSHWTVLLPGFIIAGIGIGLANPTIAGAALRVVDPTRTGMASGISNTSRVGGLAIGVAAMGSALQHRIGDHLTAAGYGSKYLSAAVSSAGLHAVSNRPALIPIADEAFLSGFKLLLLIGSVTVLFGAATALMVRPRRQSPAGK
ncbi:MAG: MFS transporter [Mycobacteriales bacterium]